MMQKQYEMKESFTPDCSPPPPPSEIPFKLLLLLLFLLPTKVLSRFFFLYKA
jgi:hypothetical protein